MTEQELKQLAEEYVVAKREADKFKKQAEGFNTELKTAMESLDIEEVELEDGSRVHYGVTTKESLDEEKLLVQLKKFAPDTECIKTKEYVDMDILESEIYHDKLTAEALGAMDSCRTVKEIPTLTIKKAKKGK